MNEKFKGRTGYQIFVDRFCRGREKDSAETKKAVKDAIDLTNGIDLVTERQLRDWDIREPLWQPDEDKVFRNRYYYGGDLKGIESKLKYIKELGFDMIYLTPLFYSSAYHHYDVANHLVLDPWIATGWEEFKELCDKCHEMDILVICDMVFNHTGSKSKYFNREKYDHWYKKINGQYSFWWGNGDMPECNTEDINYQKAMRVICRCYLRNGCDGFRLDLGEILPDGFLDALNELKTEYPDMITISEMWNLATDPRNGNGYKLFEHKFDSVMNYPGSNAILMYVRTGNYLHFKYVCSEIEKYPDDTRKILLNVLSTHDTPTTMTMLAGDKINEDVYKGNIWDIETPFFVNTDCFTATMNFRKFEAENDELTKERYMLAKNRSMIAYSMLYFLPGIPSVYQGAAICETGYKDPFSRKPYKWSSDEKEMKEVIKKLGELRKNNKEVLINGNLEILEANEIYMVLARKIEKEALVLIVNRQEKDVIYNLNHIINRYDMALSFSCNIRNTHFKRNLTVELAGYGIFTAKFNTKSNS